MGYLEKIRYWKSGQALEQTAQGGNWIPIPEGLQKMCRCGTLGHGLAGMVVLGWWLDLVILDIFPNLWFSDSM